MRWGILTNIISNIAYTQFYSRPYGGVIVRNASSVSLSFKVLGDSLEPDTPPIILLHGLLGKKTHWESVGKTIMNTAKCGVVVADLRNHGDSPHTSSHTYIELAEDIKNLIKKLNIDKTTLLGHSMGGRTAMSLALMTPEVVASIIVVDISPISNCAELTESMPKILKAMREVDFTKVDPKLVSVAKTYARLQLEDLITDNITLRAVLSNIKINKAGRIGWMCNLEGLIKNFDQIVTFPKNLMKKKYLGPALFVGGQLSEFLPADDLPGIRAMFPNSVITYVKGTGHNVHTDDPLGFYELVIAFLKDNK